jgi:hypothetical protein
MKPVSPVVPRTPCAAEIVIAKDQPQYEPLPAIPLEGGVLLTRWELSSEDLARINVDRSVYLYIYTFGSPVQPLYMTVDPPEFILDDASKEVPGV